MENRGSQVKGIPHLLIIWSKGLSAKEEIIEDLDENFNILEIVNISWTEVYFFENLKRFYSHSQKHRDEDDYNEIIKNKINHCGNGPFIAIIFEDENPKFEDRETSSGLKKVNTNVFDKKTYYRSITGGGHKIHASDDYFETKKDLALLFGIDVNKDLINLSYDKLEEKKSTNNILGVPHWNSLTELFFVLNNSIEYVVLRNFECLPDEYHIEGHGDIDLLVDNLNYIKYLTGAENVFPKKEYRVYHYINFKDRKVPFDFRYIGDSYYNNIWECNIMKNRIFNDKGFYRLDDKNYFYSLLYHAYVQKSKVSHDYKERLVILAKKINVDYDIRLSDKDSFELLDKFIKENNYSYPLPIDFTVYYNNYFVNKIEKNNYGTLIHSSFTRTNKDAFITEVYEKDNVINKVGSPLMIKKEVKYLTLLNGDSNFPSILSHNIFHSIGEVSMKKVEGELMSKLNEIKSFWNKKSIINFINISIDILISLLEKEISHRDIRPENIIVNQQNKDLRPVLIDFGWSIDINEEDLDSPEGLGTQYKLPRKGFSDSYSFGKSLNEYLKHIKFTKKTIELLMSINADDYRNKEKLRIRLQEIQEINKASKIKVKDYIALFIKKYRVLKKARSFLGKENILILHKIIKYIRKVVPV